jgi:hypothetical protein
MMTAGIAAKQLPVLLSQGKELSASAIVGRRRS